MVLHDKCPLCSSDQISFYLRCRDHLKSKEEFDLWKCSICRFIFTQGHPDENEIGSYYESDDYISHDDRATGFINRIYLLARDFMLRRKLRIVCKATGVKKGKILDIGCGTGYFAATMIKGGWDVTGIEPNTKARDFASHHFGIDVRKPEEISSLPSGYFDCVTMWHVLEHLEDPTGYAAEILRLLKPGGVCLAALPNCSSFDAKYYREYWAAYDVPRHLRHFTPETFSVFAEKTGFQLSGIQPLPLDVFYISMLSEKFKGTQLHVLTGLTKGLLFAILSLFKKGKSSSLIYFLR
ncbi:MAG: class I SAM-dependent methyltransferase [Bacteroidales bacterium]